MDSGNASQRNGRAGGDGSTAASSSKRPRITDATASAGVASAVSSSWSLGGISAGVGDRHGVATAWTTSATPWGLLSGNSSVLGLEEDDARPQRDGRGSSPPGRGGGVGNTSAIAEGGEGAPELHVIVAACAGKGGQMGVAYVDLDTPERVLHVADVLDPTFRQLQVLKQALLGDCQRQGLCVVPSRSPPALLDQASEPLRDPTEAEPFPVAISKAADFDFAQCQQRLRNLRVANGGLEDPSELSDAARELRGRSLLDMGNQQLVRACGGLVRFMEKNRAHLGDLDDAQQALHVHSVSLFSPEKLLSVDAQTMAALQVFQEEIHPSMVNRMGRSKEGMSLYGLIEPLVSSPAGRATLRRWLRQPSRDLRMLIERQDAVEQLSKPRRHELLRELTRELRECRDVAALLRRVFGCYHFDNVRDWHALATTLEHMAGAFAIILGESPGLQLGALDGAGELAADVAATEDMLHKVLDFEASSGRNEVRVRRGVDEKLDSVRDQYEAIDGYLTEVAVLERERLAELGVADAGDWLARSLAFHYFPQLGFHVSVPNPLAGEAGDDGSAETMAEFQREGCAPVEDWRFQFAGSGRLFFKCPVAIRLDVDIGDLVVAARELELELLLGVVERLRRFEPRLCRAAQVLADVDALAALALAAREYKWRRPRLVADQPHLLHIIRGRHPLSEALLTAHHGFVPNNTMLGVEGTSLTVPEASASRQISGNGQGADATACTDTPQDRQSAETRESSTQVMSPRVQVVTGANLSGKSVYLKQVGLIVLLAQVGSFVPADDAELGLCDFLFSRIQSCEGAAVRCSTFGLDLTQVSRALRHATAQSLVLLDEFGKGTQAADGVALLAATLEYLCRWPDAGPSRGPKSIVTTHFLEVFRCGLVSQKEPGLQVVSMRVMPPDENSGDVAYLYQLVSGLAKQSFGLECAKRAGLDPIVVKRAAVILTALERSLPVPPVGRMPSSTASSPAQGRQKIRAREGVVNGYGGGSEDRRVETRQREACRLVVDRLRAVDTQDKVSMQQFLNFVESQRASIAAGGVGDHW
eukprot:TRINITY_DN67328_c0_g1_i1.p1 TRINITY_DN67328_c0_g1~~TRINITY_DN67328_c0_g1_i1.p1  ORF type:complete len:1045 (-),score=180.72 TRINITY_DN67328_c0_g1_i1:522-3656(-)